MALPDSWSLNQTSTAVKGKLITRAELGRGYYAHHLSWRLYLE